MHDLLFENQGHLRLEHLLGYAKRLQLDLARFNAELTDHFYLQRVSEHLQSGRDSGVRSTRLSSSTVESRTFRSA